MREKTQPTGVIDYYGRMIMDGDHLESTTNNGAYGGIALLIDGEFLIDDVDECYGKWAISEYKMRVNNPVY
jgi:hypothetical protein